MPAEIREEVEITVGGEPWPDWESVTWTAAINEAARSLSFEVAVSDENITRLHAVFLKRTPIVVTSNGDMIFNGRLDRKQPSQTSTRRGFRVSARSKGAALIDNSAVHDTGRFRNQTPDAIAKAIDETGIDFVMDPGASLVIPRFQLTPGETGFLALERLLRDRKMTLRGEADGSIAITKGPTGKRHSGGLIEGITLGDASSDHNFAGRHAKYIVRGQSPDGTGSDATEIEEEADDDAVEGPRTRVLIADKDMQKAEAADYAKHLRDRAAGESLRAEATQPGWRDETGELWTPGHLQWLESPFLDLAQDMLLERVSATQTKSQGTGGGSKATLSFVDPRSYGGKKGKGSKSGATWSQSED